MPPCLPAPLTHDMSPTPASGSDEEQHEDIKRQLVRQFRRLTGCTAAEALYYLEQHEYRIGDAVRERAHDHAWESERATLVRNILDEEQMAASRIAAEEAAAAAAVAAEEELHALALKQQARVAAHAEALRSLSACLGRDDSSNARCLACFS